MSSLPSAETAVSQAQDETKCEAELPESQAVDADDAARTVPETVERSGEKVQVKEIPLQDAEAPTVERSGEKVQVKEIPLQDAEAPLEKIKPTPTARRSSDRERPGASRGGRKSALKKGSKRRQDGTRSSSGARLKGLDVQRKGAFTTKMASISTFIKPVAMFGWRCRSLVMFATAVYTIHTRGDFLAV